jgi:hypothetical protein
MPKRKPKPTKLTAAECCARARAARPQIPDGMVGKVFQIVATPELIDQISDMTPVERGQIFREWLASTR